MTTASEPRSDLITAARIIKSGGLVIVGTETFYALAADPFQEQALRKIFAIKGRQDQKPLPLIASDRAHVNEISLDPGPWVSEMMDRFWPGSFTILLEPAFPVSPLLTGPGGKIGVRVPTDCPARELAAAAGGLITATSANPAGDPASDRIRMIAPQLLDQVDLVMDSGSTPGGMPSTVVEPLDRGVRIVREGIVSRSQLLDFLDD